MERKLNRYILTGLATLVLGAAATTQAGNGYKPYVRDRGRDDLARVVHVEPVVERVRYSVPVEQCRDAQQIRQRCEVRHETRWEEKVVGYRVTYVYNGRRDVTRLSYDPGRYFRLADARRWS